jgi:hypothetical protein
MKRTPLRRKTPLKAKAPKKAKAKPKGLKRTKLKPMSPERRRASTLYRDFRKMFLKERPICERCSNRHSRDVHHKKGRGKHYLDVESWAAVCRECHDWIHGHPKQAREDGWLITPDPRKPLTN